MNSRGRGIGKDASFDPEIPGPSQGILGSIRRIQAWRAPAGASPVEVACSVNRG